MKRSQIVLPLSVAVASLAWLAWQRGSILQAQRQHSELLAGKAAREQRLAEHRGDAATASPKDAALLRSRWKQAGLDYAMSGSAEFGPFLRFRRLLLEMSPQELAAAIQEVEGLDLPAVKKDNLLLQMISILAVSDPAGASGFCELLKDSWSPGTYKFCVSSVLSEWADRDASAAAAWLDSLLAQGRFSAISSFQGTHGDRCLVEATLAKTLARTDLKAAVARLNSLPERDRQSVFSMSRPGCRQDAAAWIALAREVQGDVSSPLGLSIKSTITSTGQYLYYAFGIDSIEPYFKDIGASPEERGPAIGAVVSSQLQRDYDIGPEEMTSRLNGAMEWLGRVDPDHANTIAANILAQQGQMGGFEDIARRAADYSTSHGDDGLLAAFLSTGPARQHAGEALPFVEKISDPATREAVRSKLEGQSEEGTPAQ